MGIEQKKNYVIHYHNQTKHYPNRFASAPGFLEWDTQPNPFRFYRGAEKIGLPFRKDVKEIPYLNIYKNKINPTKDFNLQNLGIFLEYALGLSAWKSIPGATWSLRINPSSGNLHPTEGYLVLPDLPDLKSGIYHYSPYLHSLERRALLTSSLKEKLFEFFQGEGFVVGLSSIYWRESWKYGERAYRYCHLDLGHALACIRMSANLLGWNVTCLNQFSHEDVDEILGLRQMQQIPAEIEEGDILCLVHHSKDFHSFDSFSYEILEEFRKLDFSGVPNQLSGEHVDWEIINIVASNCKKDRTASTPQVSPDYPPMKDYPKNSSSAHIIIKGRRSALAMDGETSITKDQFLSMLDKTLPRSDAIPFDLELCEPKIHLVLFVHRVEGLDQGVYIFVRNPDDFKLLRTKLNPEYSWGQVEEDFPLYQLAKADVRSVAAAISCGQAIAGDSAFSLAMLANFEKSVHVDPTCYPVLYWESGIIGQVLYLEAEAHGVRSTGIGCFFDDPVHEYIGLKDNSFQSMYHFTVGGAVDDVRLQTLRPYHHLK